MINQKVEIRDEKINRDSIINYHPQKYTNLQTH